MAIEKKIARMRTMANAPQKTLGSISIDILNHQNYINLLFEQKRKAS
jgi:hypothetical protein